MKKALCSAATNACNTWKKSNILASSMGLGCTLAHIKVYIANRPDFADIPTLEDIRPLRRGEIADIGSACGNGWRKVFNVYAKFVFALKVPESQSFCTWQDYRDQLLLQASSEIALLFSAPQISKKCQSVHIVMGRTYARRVLKEHKDIKLTWLTPEFAIDRYARLIVCPYFDYRQLSNQKIIQLVELVRSLGDELASLG